MKNIALISLLASLMYWTACRETGQKDLCACNLSEQQDANDCPIAALGDSIVICKKGSIRFGASVSGDYSWLAYMKSKHSGAEGKLRHCRSGKELIEDPWIGTPDNKRRNYRGKKIYVKILREVDVYDHEKEKWAGTFSLPVYRRVVFAKEDSVYVSDKAFIFKPPHQKASAFQSAIAQYQKQKQKKEELFAAKVYNRERLARLDKSTINKLFVSAVNGSEEAQNILLRLPDEFAEYLATNTYIERILMDKIQIYKRYMAALEEGQAREYLDMSKFLYFQKKNPATRP